MTTRGTLVALVLVVAALAGCASGSSEGAAPPSTTAPSTSAAGATPDATCPSSAEGAAPGRTVVEVSSGGRERSYVRYVPAGYDGTEPAPVVLDLTAYSPASMEEAFSGFTTPDADGAIRADAVGAVVLTPEPVNGKGLLTWNIDGTEGWTDDQQFLTDVLDDAAGAVCTDPDRVLVAGFAIGGVMASAFACEHADRVAVVATVSGLWDPPGCDPSEPTPAISFHGDGDHFLPYPGGIGDHVGELGLTAETSEGLVAMAERPGAVEASTAWAERNGCDAPQATGGPEGTELTTWSGCDDGADVELHTIDGGSHTWPGSTGMASYEGLLGPVSTSIDATDVILAFFEAHAPA